MWGWNTYSLLRVSTIYWVDTVCRGRSPPLPSVRTLRSLQGVSGTGSLISGKLFLLVLLSQFQSVTRRPWSPLSQENSGKTQSYPIKEKFVCVFPDMTEDSSTRFLRSGAAINLLIPRSIKSLLYYLDPEPVLDHLRTDPRPTEKGFPQNLTVYLLVKNTISKRKTRLIVVFIIDYVMRIL